MNRLSRRSVSTILQNVCTNRYRNVAAPLSSSDSFNHRSFRESDNRSWYSLLKCDTSNYMKLIMLFSLRNSPFMHCSALGRSASPAEKLYYQAENNAFGMGIALPTSSIRDYGASLPSYRCLTLGYNQSPYLVLPSSTRNIATSASSGASASSSPDASEAFNVSPRIKFKRLDKTARHIMQILDKEEVKKVKADREIPDIQPGYIIQLKVEVPENKRRVSTIKGIVIARRNAGLNTTFRLRRQVAGVGIESLFPLYSPNIKEIQVLEKKKVKRAKLYYLRDKMNALKGK